MITTIAIMALFAAAMAGLLAFRKNAEPARGKALEGAWSRAQSHDQSSAVNKMLLSVARPLSQLPQTQLASESALYKMLRIKLAAAGSLFGGSVEVFLSVQVLTVLIGAIALLLAVAAQLDGLFLGGVALFAAALAALPYNRISSEAKKRAELVSVGLPEFAELLLMPITSGYSIIPALDFTANRLEGPVASEVRLMLQLLNSRAASEYQAFTGAGERLGTPSSITFFNTLYQAFVDGVKIADIIKSQAEQLRKTSYERSRGKMKALPNRLVLIMGMHLIPFLFVVVLLPTFVALGSM